LANFAGEAHLPSDGEQRRTLCHAHFQRKEAAIGQVLWSSAKDGPQSIGSVPSAA
jgi:hypothetical protein